MNKIRGDIHYGDLYKDGAVVRKRREWRGLVDTLYDDDVLAIQNSLNTFRIFHLYRVRIA